MCECLDYEDGDRYQCPMCADEGRALRAENERLRGQIALIVWSSPVHRVTIRPGSVMLFPIPWELVTWKNMETGAEVLEVRALAAPQEEKERDRG